MNNDPYISEESEPRQQQAENILDLLREKYAQVARRSLRGVVLQPGAIGDCILTLPLVHFLKETLDLGAVDMIAHTDYVGMFPGRTAVDKVRSLESVELHRLFTNPASFELADRDALISAFSEYAWVLTFMGGPNTDFETNLVYTIHCNHSADVVSLTLTPTASNRQHISLCYMQQFLEQYPHSQPPPVLDDRMTLCHTTDTDRHMGRQIIKQRSLATKQLIVLHPGSGSRAKCWHLENFKAVARVLSKQDYQPVFLLGPAEQERFSCNQIEELMKIAPVLTDLSLEQVLAVLSVTQTYIGNDSGITHLAAACGINTLALFSATCPQTYRPIGPRVHVFHDNDPGFAERPNIILQEQVQNAFDTSVG
jgi:ADP-heptose:LPS heptosyltransferase